MDIGRFAAKQIVVCTLFALTGCDSPTIPSSQQPVQLNLTGTWTGAASDTSGPGSMIWHLSQTGSSCSGTLTMSDTATSKAGRGSVSGTVSGTALHFTIDIPAGGFDSPYDSCSTEVAGDAQASASSIAGTYSGTNSCTGIIASGQFALAKSQ